MKKIKTAVLIVMILLITLTFFACNEGTSDYTISFDSQGGSNVFDTLTNGKSVVDLPEEPIRNGYNFKGWYFDKSYERPFSYDNLLDKPINEDFTLYAKWVPSVYKINFYANGGLLISGNKRQRITHGETIVAPVVQKAGYNFVEWDKDLSQIHDNTSVFAIYTPKTYVITFDKQGGENGPDSLIVEFDCSLPILTKPTKGDYSFGGYYTEPNGLGEKYYDSQMISYSQWDIDSDTTLYAKWYYPVMLDSADGLIDNKTIEAVIGGDMPHSIKPTKKGYSFKGFFSELNGQGTQYYGEDMQSVKKWDIESAATLYAYWVVNNYEVTLDNQNSIDDSDIVTAAYGQSMPGALAPYKSGYSFDGYYSQPDGEGVCYYNENMESQKVMDKDSNFTLYAKWVLNEGTEGLAFQLIQNSHSSVDEYAVTGYSGESTEIYVPISYNGKAVTQIANNAFYEFISITNVVLPDSIKHIGERAFSDCISLLSIELSSNTLLIDKYAFSHCISLRTIVIPDSVQTISTAAFAECSNLESVILGKGLTCIAQKVFENCISLEAIVLPDNIISVSDYAFNNCLNLNQITFSQKLNLIGDYAFSQCSSLTEILLPQSLISIGEGAFNCCDGVFDINIPEKVKFIGQDAFVMKALKSVIINNPSPCSIGFNSFANSSINQVYIYVPQQSLSLYKDAIVWSEFQSNIFSSDIIVDDFAIIEGALLQYIGSNATIIIPDGITSIEEYAFSDNIDIMYVNNPTPPSFSGDYPDSLTKVYVPSESVEDYKSNWSQIQDIIFPIE